MKKNQTLKTKAASKAKSKGKPKKENRRVGRPNKDTDQSVRDLILRAFLHVCQEDGIETVTIQKIADHSRVALTSVRYHFQMQGLSLSQVALNFVADKNFDFIDKYLTEARNKKNFDPVKAYIESQFNWLEEEKLEASFLFYYFYMCTTKLQLTVSNKELLEIAQRRVLSLIHEGIGNGAYTVKADLADIAIQAYLIISGTCMVVATSRDSEFASKQKKVCFDFVASLLNPNPK